VTDLFLWVHRTLAALLLVLLPVTVVWGSAEFVRGARLSWVYDKVLWVVQILILAQVVAGIAALFAGRAPRDPLHIVYGSGAALLLPAVWLVVRRRRRVSLDMAITCAIIAVASVSALMTGS
jgi:hypothetical protein